MNVAAWHEEPIRKKHDREAFDCGEAALNEFLRRHARKSHDLGGAKTFLAIADADNRTVLGFYSLSPASVGYARAPEIVRRGLARQTWPLLARSKSRCRALRSKGGGRSLIFSARPVPSV